MSDLPSRQPRGVTIWRLVLMAGLMAMVGFVGGVWFISSGLGFRWISPPQIPSTIPAMGGTLLRLSPATKGGAAIGLPPSRNLSGGSGGLLPRAERTDLMPSPGCFWEVEPRPFQPDQDWHLTTVERTILGIPLVDATSGRSRYVLVQSPRHPDLAVTLRVVFFDEAANRYPSLPDGQSSSRSSDVFFEVTRYQWPDDLPIKASGATYFGVERVVGEKARLTGETAQNEARSRGVAILPPLRMGEPYHFDLPTPTTAADGRVRSADLQGKVVLVVIWGPGSKTMGPVRDATKDFKPEDLAIVGVSFDSTIEDASALFDPLQDKGSLVFVPNDRQIRRFWTDGAAISQLPTYWLVDRAGVLRFESSLRDLPARIKTLLGQAPQANPVH